ncbi:MULTISPECIES: DUF397 domain-containing protein [Streptomyces]|uniref:DUF397 domain-containing protein n=1 Tax=Streptomyces TaxID=1883 RepID=UPI00069BF4D3|nr:DUF397 domain-containing protein [Streptomyces sp. SID7805]MYU50951.1 DUF397 domain-containing protein [Streptomyces sp. SID7805]
MTRRPVAAESLTLAWFKSSYSTNEHGSDCVEVAAAPGVVHVRDSKDVRGPNLGFAPDAWAAFVTYAAQD